MKKTLNKGGYFEKNGLKKILNEEIRILNIRY